MENNKGQNRELLPSSKQERTMGLLGYSAMWVGFAVIIATFELGGSGVQSFPIGWVILACLVGNIITGIFITLGGEYGLEHGIPSPMYWRVIFGPMGSVIPSLIRGILACCWTGIQTYFGATAMAYIVAFITGFDNWFVCFVIFLAIQILNAAFGINAIDKFAMFAAPCILIISIWILISINGYASENALDVFGSVYVPGEEVLGTPQGITLASFVTVMFTNMAYWSTNCADNGSVEKYISAKAGERKFLKRNKEAIVAHLVALPVVQTFIVAIGGLSMLAYGTWNPVDALQQTIKGVGLLVLLLLVVLAQWSTNTGASILPGAMTFMNIVEKVTKKHLPFKAAVITVGVIAILIQPWKIMEVFGTFLNMMGSLYGPICGAALADYYIIRKRRLNVPDIFKKDGQFNGAAGWNIAGIIALAAGFVVGIVFPYGSFLPGVVVAFVIYLIIAKGWWFKKHPQIEIESNYDDKYLGITNNNYWEGVTNEIDD